MIEQFARLDAYRSTHCYELGHVETAFSEFEFRHERLTLPEAFTQFHLRYARVLPSLHEQFDHSLVEVGTK